MGILGFDSGFREPVMTLENREDANLGFLNPVDDPVVSDQDFPHVLTTDLGNNTAGVRLLRGSPCASPETL